MDSKKKKKLKIKMKAGLRLAKDAVLWYTLGVLGASYTVGLPNAIHEFENNAYSLVLEIDNDKLTDFSNRHITAVRIDMSEPNAIQTLESCTNLKSIEIHNAQLLNDYFIHIMNGKNLKEIHLVFNKEDVLRKISGDVSNNRFDLNRFSNKESIKSIKFSKIDNREVDGLVLLNYLTNYDDLDLEFKKYKDLDDTLTNIVESLDLSTWSDDMMNLIKLADFEINYLEYDPEALEYTSKHENIKDDKKMFELIKKYNVESLSTILDPEKLTVVDYTRQVKSICVNFQDMFLMLCIKGGIECYPIDGNYVDGLKSGTHGWNLIKLQNNYYLMDLTYFDSFDELNELMNKFMKGLDYEDYLALCNSLLIPLDSEQAKHYVSNKDINALMAGVLEKGEYQYIYGTEDSKKLLNFMGLAAVVTWFILGTSMVFIDLKIKAYKERKKQEQLISESAIFNNPENEHKRR